MKTTKTFEQLKEFYLNKKNWRPPSYTQIMRYAGWKSKNAAAKFVKKMKTKPKVKV